MEYRTLGRTGLRVSALGMGGLFISSRSAARDEARLAVRRALELGVTYFDTAPGYHDSEQVLGEALEAVREPYILSTKLGGRPQPFDPRDKDALRRSVEESLRNLHRDSLDLLLIHEPDRPVEYDWFTDPERFTGPVTELLAALKEEGLVRYTGLGGTTAYELPHIIATGVYDVVLTAFNYSALARSRPQVLPAAKSWGWHRRSPLQQGALARRYDQEVSAPGDSRAAEAVQAFYALLTT